MNDIFFQRMLLLCLLDFFFKFDYIIRFLFKLMKNDSEIIKLVLDLFFLYWMQPSLIINWFKVIFVLIIHQKFPHTYFAALTSRGFILCIFIDRLQRKSLKGLYAVFAAIQGTELALLLIFKIFFRQIQFTYSALH